MHRKKREMDTYSTTSGTSKTSGRSRFSQNSERRKTPRFSLRDIFYRAQTRPLSDMQRRRVTETQSEGNIHSRIERDRIERDKDALNARDLTSLQSIGSEEGSPKTDSTLIKRVPNERGCFECPLCLDEHKEEFFPNIMTCAHRSCITCLKQYLTIEISESRIGICCPECSARFHPNDISAILQDLHLMSKYEEFMLRRVLVTDSDVRWCPAPDCGYAVIAAGCASCPKLRCERPGCGTSFCYHCKQTWHPNQTCDAARAERSPNLRSDSLSFSHDSNNAQSDIKPCPRCGAFIVKMDDGSCNHMTCAVCGAEFCWLCMKEISDLHYLSPSGCTFWGKKPWSRKKKILWQLGMLAGAPVGISLVAGIAVPAMIIGIPVWVGRKLHTKYENAGKHKRNLAITGGVASSILVSPIVAGLAVSIGVPILLAYVYGVVPISLCRSGGCGVSTSTTGVRFEFDDDNEVTVGVSGPFSSGDNQSVGTASHNVANPSIGPSIGDASLAFTQSLSASGSQMDRAGIIRDESDRDSASNRAMAGASLNGSLSGSTVAGSHGFSNRLEVHADVTTSHSMMGSDKYSLKSAAVSFDDDIKGGDDASTRTLHGSLVSNRDKDNVSITTAPSIELTENPRSRHNSSSSHSKNLSNHGSPTSNRSVNFLDDGLRKLGSKKKYKRQCISVGDKIHEHSEKSPDAMSVKSLEAGATCKVEPQLKSTIKMEKTTTSGSSSIRKAVLEVHKVSLNTSDSSKGSLSSSYESVTSHGAQNKLNLPEVEVDRPRDGPHVQISNVSSSIHINKQSEESEKEIKVSKKEILDGTRKKDTYVKEPRRRTSCEIAMSDLVSLP
ncbi:unnamed protein product [Owenia fusiformis]|uniref:RBR-type E3 ubiquitin transferase n=1 Tax=Owenia fusiformis TaxID=6347 RepID=A0A8S4N336_OWEFU|nr:unnamed protein product [Owenia fusiformis]